MFHSTTDVYVTKRETIHFAKNLVSESGQVESKFITQTIYCLLKSKSVILRNIAVALNEFIQVKNTSDRLSQNLQRPSPSLTTRYAK